MKKCKNCEKRIVIELKLIKIHILIVLLLASFISNNLFANQAPPVESNYANNSNISKTLVTDSDRDGIYDTYTVFWSDGTTFSYPISAVGDIRRWPPRGIPTRDISNSNVNTRSFVENYYGINNSPVICQFVKKERIDSIYYYDYFEYSIIANVNDQSNNNLAIEILPNPTKDLINISYSLHSEGWVSISIYNEIGVLLEDLENSYRYPGSYTVLKNLATLPNGVYFITTKYGMNEFITRKIILNK